MDAGVIVELNAPVPCFSEDDIRVSSVSRIDLTTGKKIDECSQGDCFEKNHVLVSLARQRAFHKLSGRYLIYGFMGNLNTFDVFRDGGNFFTSGQDDTNGELFPPYRSAFEKCTDGCFRWQAWPGIVTFHDGDDSGKITIEMPGIGIYDGERVGDAQPA